MIFCSEKKQARNLCRAKYIYKHVATTCVQRVHSFNFISFYSTLLLYTHHAELVNEYVAYYTRV